MAPSNPYVEDPTNRTAIMQHDKKMIRRTGEAFGDDDPIWHYDLNRRREVELLARILTETNESDLIAGELTLDGLAHQLYGISDEYLTKRLRGHLSPSSVLQRAFPDGTIYLADPEGRVLPKNRNSEARRIAEEITERASVRLMTVTNREMKRLQTGLKRATRLAPGVKAELSEIVEQGVDTMSAHVASQGRLALEAGQ